jgi:TetR/AcrR family transcriptional regulator, regulator of cefoperazone and chloramphenicol sensitivity
MSIHGTETQRTTRSDGEPSRSRLLRAALALFAQHGYAKTSTREIAEAARTNIAAISYYFGDKAGLYRAVFFEPLGTPCETVRIAAEPSLEQALRAFYTGLLEPLRQGDLARQCMKLHFREMLEPTGLWEEDFTHGMRPMHDALVAALMRHFELQRADDEVLRLAVCIAGLGVHLHVGRDVIDALAPQLNTHAQSLDVWIERLVMYARAMIDADALRRAAPAAAAMNS